MMTHIILLGLCVFFVPIDSGLGHPTHLPVLAPSSPVCRNPVPRSSWGARPARAVSYFGHTPTRVVIMTTGTAGCTTRLNCAYKVQALQVRDMSTHDKDDTTCSFLLAGDNQVYEGRGWNKKTEYVDSLVLCMVGYARTTPSSLQKDVLKNFLTCAETEKKLTQTYIIQAPFDVTNSTEKLYDFVKTLARYKPGGAKAASPTI